MEAHRLAVGETVRTRDGSGARVLGLERLPGVHAVFNLEVEGLHPYHVSPLGLLAHNNSKCETTNTSAQNTKGANEAAEAGGDVSQIQKNAENGKSRESYVQSKLEGKFGEGNVQREQYLRTSDGKIAKDPVTGEGRRIDHVVIQDGNARFSIETTSKTADKQFQIDKETRIRSSGGNFVRDRTTKKLVDISKVKTRLSRRR